jgi:polyhydroxybutyrate depolymerase
MRRYSFITALIGTLVIPMISFPQVQTGSFEFEGRMRDYFVFLPQNYDGLIKMPLVFSLHGYTLDAKQQMDYSRMNVVADTGGFIVVYPNAVSPGWNCGIAGSPNINDVGFIDALIDTLSNHYYIDTTMIYSCGFSLGGFMSFRLACQLSNRISAVASVAGVMAQATANGPKGNHAMPVLLVHGTADGIVPYNGAYDWCSVQQTLTYWANFNLCAESDTTSLPDLDTLDGCSVEKIDYTRRSDATSVILYRVIDGGHSWPGGDTAQLHLSWGNIGNTNGDINASAEIWNFFKPYKLLTTVANQSESPAELLLFQNYPNPFNPSTTIKYELPKSSVVRLSVYDMLGREVSVLVNERMNAGVHEVKFDGSNLASGVYFYRLTAGGFVQAKKLVIVK